MLLPLAQVPRILTLLLLCVAGMAGYAEPQKEEQAPLPEQTSTPENSLLPPPPPSDPTIDAAAWESYNEPSDGTFSPSAWADTLRPRSSWQRRRYAPYPLPPASHILPPKATVSPVYRLNSIDWTGNNIYSAKQLDSLCHEFLSRPLDQEDLYQLRNIVSQHYITNGYISSGALAPAFDPQGSRLMLEIKEGHLTDAHIKGNQKLRKSYLRSRLLKGSKKPLHFPTLQKQLQVLQLNPNIRRLNAELKPGPLLGESFLIVEVEENKPWSYGFEFNNQRPPSIGAEQAELWWRTTNLTGNSDSFEFRYGILSGGLDDASFSGLDNLSLRYALPILADDTSLEISYQRQDYTIIEEPFDFLGIEGDTEQYSLGFSRPFYRSLKDDLTLKLALDHRRSRTYLLGEPFSISPGYVDGKLDLTSVRLQADWTRRSANQVLALRSALVIGLDSLGSTDIPDGSDADYIKWTFNGQYLRRLNARGDTLIVRGGLQLADDSLPQPQQITLGGYNTVRGYQENSIVRDMGAYLGIEYRLPIITQSKNSKWTLHLVPFVDAATGWNNEDSQKEHLTSVGIGLSSKYSDWLRADIFWGLPINKLSNNSHEMPDPGFHFRCQIMQF